jgi:hypothetical protein
VSRVDEHIAYAIKISFADIAPTINVGRTGPHDHVRIAWTENKSIQRNTIDLYVSDRCATAIQTYETPLADGPNRRHTRPMGSWSTDRTSLPDGLRYLRAFAPDLPRLYGPTGDHC